eukprot:jgi/Tetstr1/444319/TSEL_032210.t1
MTTARITQRGRSFARYVTRSNRSCRSSKDGARVLLYEDNNTAVVAAMTNVTSRSPVMMEELRKLWHLLDIHDISVRPRYIQSAANIWADRLSKEMDDAD